MRRDQFEVAATDDAALVLTCLECGWEQFRWQDRPGGYWPFLSTVLASAQLHACTISPTRDDDADSPGAEL